MSDLIQPSFSAGEVSPATYARVDLARYYTALRTCRNYHVLPEGGAQNRAGTRFVAETKDSSKQSRLIPFQFSTEQTFVLEFGDQYIRLFTNGASVPLGRFVANGTFDTDLSGWSVLTGSAAWDPAGAVKLITVSGIAGRIEQKITGLVIGETYTYSCTFTGLGSFRISTASGGSNVVNTPAGSGLKTGTFVATATELWVTLSNNGATSPGGDVLADGVQVIGNPGVGFVGQYFPYEIPSPYLESQLQDLKYTQSADVLTIVHPSHPPRELSRLGPVNWTLTPITFEPGIAAPTGLAATARSGGSGDKTDYQYKVTAVSSVSSGSVESWASNTASVASWDSKPGATLSWTAVTGADHYNVYKNKSSGVFGFIGQATGTTFSDINITPETNNTVPIGYNPFAEGNNPSVAGYFQQRMVFAASQTNPQTVWMSRTGDFHNFAYSDPAKDDDGVEFIIASKQVNQIRHLVSLRSLLALTSGAEIAISGGADSGVTKDNISAIEQSYFGSSDVTPAVYANTAMYVQARGGKLSTLAYNYVSDGFQPQDVSVLSSHLLRGYTVRDQAFTLAPNGILWMARNDGMLLGFTFLPDQQVYAWHWHDTDGKVESLASVPEDDEDALYLIVKRTVSGATKRYVERMATRQLTKSGSGDYWFDRAFFVDCGLTYDGRQSASAVLTGGSDWLYPNPLTLTVGAPTFTPGMVGRSVIMYGGGSETAIGNLLTVKIIGYTSPTVVTVEPQTVVPDSLRGVAATRWGLAASTISGLGHLEGKTVSILADGNVLPQVVVEGGVVVIDGPALVAHIGLPFTSDFETLDVTLQNNQAFLGQKKRINSVVVLCQESRGMSAGPDAEHLKPCKQRSTENYGEPIELLTGRAEIDIDSTWDDSGRFLIRQSDPLPLTILGVMPNVQAGG